MQELEKTNQRLLQEITARTNNEENLQADHDFISRILDTLDALVIVIDRKGSIIRVNSACKQFFGYTTQEFTHKRVWDLLLQSQDNLTIKDMFANIQAGLSPFQYANHWQTKEGVQKMMSWSSSMLYDPNGNIQYIVAVGIDITERKHIEKLLERERLLFRGLIDSIPDLIFYKNRNGVYLGWNATFSAYQDSAPLYLMDGEHRIMISDAINDSDRLSSCNKRVRKKIAPDASVFQVYSVQIGGNEGPDSGVEELRLNYNVGGICLSEPAFRKMQQEIALAPWYADFAGRWIDDQREFFVGTVPLANGAFRRIAIRKSRIAQVDVRDLSILRWTDRYYYEVCANPAVEAALPREKSAAAHHPA